MNNPLGKWCYSTDEEEYNGHCETEADANGEAQSQIDEDGEDGELREFWVAKIVHPLDCISRDVGSDVFDMLLERITDEVGGDDAALDMTTDEVNELGKVIMAYVREHASVQRYGVKDKVKRQYIAGSNA
jgi:hypothetical protein